MLEFAAIMVGMLVTMTIVILWLDRRAQNQKRKAR